MYYFGVFQVSLLCSIDDHGESKPYPGALPQTVQAKLVGDLGGVHGIGKILLVGENQKQRIPEFVFVQHPLQLLAGLNNTVTIVAVDDEDDALGVLEVMPPQRSDLVLSTDIPHGELNILVLDSFDVETYIRGWYQRMDFLISRVNRKILWSRTNGGNGRDDFTQFQLIQNGGLAGSVQTDHQDSHLLLAPEAIEQLREGETHIGGEVARVEVPMKIKKGFFNEKKKGPKTLAGERQSADVDARVHA